MSDNLKKKRDVNKAGDYDIIKNIKDIVMETKESQLMTVTFEPFDAPFPYLIATMLDSWKCAFRRSGSVRIVKNRNTPLSFGIVANEDIDKDEDIFSCVHIGISTLLIILCLNIKFIYFYSSRGKRLDLWSSICFTRTK